MVVYRVVFLSLLMASAQAVTFSNKLKVQGKVDYGLGAIVLQYADGSKSILKPDHFVHFDKEKTLRQGWVQVAKTEADHAWDSAWKTQKLPSSCLRRVRDGWSLRFKGELKGGKVEGLRCIYHKDRAKER